MTMPSGTETSRPPVYRPGGTRAAERSPPNSRACHVQDAAENEQRAKPHQEHSRLLNSSLPRTTEPGFKSHLPSAILSLPAFVSRSPPANSCMYPSWISRSLCSAGIVRCIKPLAQSRNETNSSCVNGADKSGFIFQICASGAAVQASHPATIKLTHYRAFRLDV